MPDESLEQRLDYIIREVCEIRGMALRSATSHLVLREYDAVLELFAECKTLSILLLQKRIGDINGEAFKGNPGVHGKAFH